MDLTRQDFESCFPDTQIDVTTEYEDNFPYKIIINKNMSGKISILTYIKSFIIDTSGNKIYNDFVDVLKEENGKKYFKISRFINPGKFII